MNTEDIIAEQAETPMDAEMAVDTVPSVEDEMSQEDISPSEIENDAETEEADITDHENVVENEPPAPSHEELYTEIERLRAELDQTRALHARMADELSEFHTLFPEVNTSCIPESIWEQVKNGVPLAASYALYEKKCELRRQHAEQINLHNAQHTPGSAGKNTPAEYFSPDEVRRMSQSEVSRNYQKILESMKKWSN